jgi:hypothetical protein
MNSWGIIRYRPLAGGLCDEDPCGFDGWYGDRAHALAIYKYWCREFPHWIVALVSQEQAHFPETVLHLKDADHEHWVETIRSIPR